MTKRTGLTLLAGVVLGGTAVAAVAEDLESVEKKIIAAWTQHKSVTAKMSMTSRLEAGGMVMDGKGDGTYEFLRKGGKLLCRIEVRNTMVQKVGERETKLEQQMTIVIDGEATYILTEALGRKVARKTKLDPRMTGEPKALFEQLRQEKVLTLLPEEVVDGKKSYAIQATPKQSAPTAPSREVYSFDQESGVLVKIVGFGEDDKPMVTMTYSDYKFDVKIDPERFVFKAPEGVEVIDETTATP